MHSFASIATVALGLSLAQYALAAPSAYPSGQSGQCPQGRPAKALYFQTNMPTGNSVVAVPILPNGGLDVKRYSTHATGGCGSAGMEAMNATAGPDALFSQDAVIVQDHMLFATNAGSNTFTMFKIDRRNPTCLTMVGEPAATMGEFPVAVAYSKHLKTACVLNSGAADGVACYSVSGRTGLKALDTGARKLNLGQSTPPLGPTGTVSDIFFTPDSKMLIVMVKGNPPTKVAGFVAVYPVVNGTVSMTPVKSNPVGSVALFGSSIISNTEILATDAGFGTMKLKIDPVTHVVTADVKTTIAGQAATCWSAYSPKTGSVYVTDIKMNRIEEISAASGKIVSALNFTNGNTGNIDDIVGGDFLYSLSPSLGKTDIAVVSLACGQGKMKELETFSIPGANQFSSGLAVL
ncbi:hypothetical protein H072_10528 [Dactylellina haptotyla CBS 200.50]|uniref:SMP-30/Gluconolactonase/LRE-like region domain-containing protein n=1 Tax=Dactylellina haptotyla (strain CBS 200.50) TaxID=1284197 RepID=S8BLJ6_DACHA|nr:hypothetical protein H072_10528 [Dactylellina haptotyla CBS 200.50]